MSCFLFCFAFAKSLNQKRLPAVSADWNEDKMDFEWQDAIQGEVPSSDVIRCLWSELIHWLKSRPHCLLLHRKVHVPTCRLGSSLRTGLRTMIMIALRLFVVSQSAGADQLHPPTPCSNRIWFSLASIWPPFLLLPSVFIMQHNGDEICT